MVETTETGQPFEIVGSGAFVKVRLPGAPGKVTVKKGLISEKLS